MTTVRITAATVITGGEQGIKVKTDTLLGSIGEMNAYRHLRSARSRPARQEYLVIGINGVIQLHQRHIRGSVTGPQRSPAVEIINRPISIPSVLSTTRCPAGRVLMIPVNHHAGCIRRAYTAMVRRYEIRPSIVEHVVDSTAGTGVFTIKSVDPGGFNLVTIFIDGRPHP